jgi:hypothetical protein
VATSKTTEVVKYRLLNSPWYGQIAGCLFTLCIYPYVAPAPEDYYAVFVDGVLEKHGRENYVVDRIQKHEVKMHQAP